MLFRWMRWPHYMRMLLHRVSTEAHKWHKEKQIVIKCFSMCLQEIPVYAVPYIHHRFPTIMRGKQVENLHSVPAICTLTTRWDQIVHIWANSWKSIKKHRIYLVKFGSQFVFVGFGLDSLPQVWLIEEAFRTAVLNENSDGKVTGRDALKHLIR